MIKFSRWSFVEEKSRRGFVNLGRLRTVRAMPGRMAKAIGRRALRMYYVYPYLSKCTV